MTKPKRINVVATLPSGVNKIDFTIRVLEGGMSLELKVIWPTPMIDLWMPHQKWLRPSETEETPSFTMYHPALLELYSALKKRRERASNDVVLAAPIFF